MRTSHAVKTLAALTVLWMLTACGGGGEDGADTPQHVGINPPACVASSPSCL